MTAHETQDDLLSYALGEVSSETASRIREHLIGCTECRRELRATSEALGAFAMREAVSPPSHIRQKLLGKIHSPQVTEGKSRFWGNWFWVPVFASLMLTAVALWLWHENSYLRQQLEASNARLTSPSFEDTAIRKALASPDSEQFSLVPVKSIPMPQGKAIYRPHQGSIIFIGSHFANVPAGKAYELWLLPASGGAPIAASVFKPDAAGNVAVLIPHLNGSVEAKGFAVTMELETGSETPTMPILLIGTRSQA